MRKIWMSSGFAISLALSIIGNAEAQSVNCRAVEEERVQRMLGLQPSDIGRQDVLLNFHSYYCEGITNLFFVNVTPQFAENGVAAPPMLPEFVDPQLSSLLRVRKTN